MDSRARVPVQGVGPNTLPAAHSYRRQWVKEHGREPVPPGTVEWSEHAEAWREYALRGHGSQSAERVAERGGFCFFELTDLLGHEPRTWRPR